MIDIIVAIGFGLLAVWFISLFFGKKQKQNSNSSIVETKLSNREHRALRALKLN